MSANSRAVEVAGDEYALGDSVPVDGLAAVPTGTNLIVIGPSMLGTETIALDVLEHGLRRGENAVAITSDQPANRVLSRFEDVDAPDDAVQVVDCSSAGDPEDLDDTGRVTSVGSPGNLTDIGVCLTKATQTIGDGATAGVRVGLLSLSTFLRYADVDGVFKFVHVATSRFAAAGYCCVATIDSTTHDDDTLNTIKAQFDGAIELREAADGTRETRAVGFPEVAASWGPG